ncbi:alkaline phosphatase-like [Atheta coriaria]|uniref:alkaline phosphatase-like n=1 Tax=Dalotia coriaria TaxID=877792 RepID=UPI0031F474A1
MMDSKWFLLLLGALAIVSIGGQYISTEDKASWGNMAKYDIHRALKVQQNTRKAKNVILFVGDGMGLSTVTASRILEKGEKGFLAFEKLPHIGVLKTYSANKLVPDSMATATALFTGVKTNQRTGGVDATVQQNDCPRSLLPETRLESFFTWAQRAKMSTGFVTTTRVTHATPAALYAHTASRYWECEATMPPNATQCKDIARQLIEDMPGKNINVIMGGGRQMLQSNAVNRTKDFVDTWACYSRDGRQLINGWVSDKMTRNVSHQFLENSSDIEKMKITDYTLGIFANGHMNMEHERDKGHGGMPSLSYMTEAAIKLLEKRNTGYVLLVEGGLIDYGHHRGKAKKALGETISFSEAISKAMAMVNLEETLIIVTSDHGHPMVIAGYADRDQKITGIAGNSKIDGIPYTSLLYGIGGPNNYKYQIINETVFREDPERIDTDDFDYSQQAGVRTHEVPHDGTDVLVYAQGPMAHLFHTVHEQTYVAYVIAYAAQIGPYAHLADAVQNHANWKSVGNNTHLLAVFLLYLNWRQ